MAPKSFTRSLMQRIRIFFRTQKPDARSQMPVASSQQPETRSQYLKVFENKEDWNYAATTEAA